LRSVASANVAGAFKELALSRLPAEIMLPMPGDYFGVPSQLSEVK
jgi:hypothetical protein